MKEYDAYLKNYNYADFVKLFSNDYENNIFVSLFGTATSTAKIDKFEQMIQNIIKTSLYNRKMNNNNFVKTSFSGADNNGLTILKITQKFQKFPKTLPDIIFQSNQAKDMIILNPKYNQESAVKVYQEKDNHKCEICGRSIKANNFIYVNDGKYFGKTCFEENVLPSFAIKDYLTVIDIFVQNLMLMKDNDVMNNDLKQINPDFQGQNIKKHLEELFLNNEVIQKDLNNDKDKIKEVADLVAEYIFNYNFISIPNQEKLEPKEKVKLFRKNSYDFKEFSKYLYPKIRDIGYVKRMRNYENLAYSVYGFVLKYVLNNSNQQLDELKSLINDFKHSDPDNIEIYTSLLTKMMPLLNLGIKNRSTLNKATWYIDTKPDVQLGFKQLEKIELGDKTFYLFQIK